MGKLKNKNSTSAEPVIPITPARELNFGHLGQVIQVCGRDITLGLSEKLHTEWVGRLESLRMNPDRMVCVLTVRHPRFKFASPRVIELAVTDA